MSANRPISGDMSLNFASRPIGCDLTCRSTSLQKRTLRYSLRFRSRRSFAASNCSKIEKPVAQPIARFATGRLFLPGKRKHTRVHKYFENTKLMRKTALEQGSQTPPSVPRHRKNGCTAYCPRTPRMPTGNENIAQSRQAEIQLNPRNSLC